MTITIVSRGCSGIVVFVGAVVGITPIVVVVVVMTFTTSTAVPIDVAPSCQISVCSRCGPAQHPFTCGNGMHELYK